MHTRPRPLFTRACMHIIDKMLKMVYDILPIDKIKKK